MTTPPPMMCSVGEDTQDPEAQMCRLMCRRLSFLISMERTKQLEAEDEEQKSVRMSFLMQNSVS